jgi:hypothetical protein
MTPISIRPGALPGPEIKEKHHINSSSEMHGTSSVVPCGTIRATHCHRNTNTATALPKPLPPFYFWLPKTFDSEVLKSPRTHLTQTHVFSLNPSAPPNTYLKQVFITDSKLRPENMMNMDFIHPKKKMNMFSKHKDSVIFHEPPYTLLDFFHVPRSLTFSLNVNVYILLCRFEH